MLGGFTGCLGCILCKKSLRLSLKVDECKPLPHGRAGAIEGLAADQDGARGQRPAVRCGRGALLHVHRAAVHRQGAVHLRRHVPAAVQARLRGRALHSSTSRLSVSAFCGSGGGFGGSFGVVQEEFRRVLGRLGCILCQKRLRLS